ncbi:MAG TPA: GAF domain-containing sensor histidine kinase [Ktedonobacteraceae bacterium]|nr:GAF domain-containing sensor histidine kinase [Ktedonobacteraceae bacterium]
MNLDHAQPDRSMNLQSASQVDTRLYGGWLILARVAWIALVLVLLGFLFVSLPANFAVLHQPCSGALCPLGGGQMFASEMSALPQSGLSLDAYAMAWIILSLVEALIWIGVGALLFWRKSDDWMALLVALMLISWGVNNTTNNLLYTSSLWSIPENAVQLIVSLAWMFTLALFPNGRFVPRWTVWITLIDLMYIAAYLLFLRPLNIPGWLLFSNPPGMVIWFSWWILLTLAQLYRYFRVSNRLERQQTKWVGFSFFFVLVSLGVAAILPNPQPIQHNGILTVLLPNTYTFITLLIPISFGFAILRSHLWDIDIIINRTLVYGLLTACVIGIYAFVVGILDTLLQAQGNFFIALVAAGLVAVLFQPLRLYLQRGVNRLMYGERDTPEKVISRLGQRLEVTLAPNAVLPTIVETVAQALKLPYAAITLEQGDAFVLAAAYGKEPGEDLLRLPLVYQNEQIGELLLAPRAPGEAFSSADRTLLNELARQAGIAAHAVRLTSDLQRVAVELQRSRTQLVTTREEERRRLRRDLHDGLGPALGSLTLQLDTARNLYKSDPSAADALLVDLKAQVQTAIADIRRLVYELRPPTLDELGLVSALREQVNRYRQQGQSITFNTPEHMPLLPAAVEVAIYRIAQEALTNVVVHANAHHCVLSLEMDDHVCLEIRDDGLGLAEDFRAGVGLTSMRERAAELDGSCVIESLDVGGTRVFIRLPLLKE